MGQPVNVENCKRVARDGYQRQHIRRRVLPLATAAGSPPFPAARWLGASNVGSRKWHGVLAPCGICSPEPFPVGTVPQFTQR